jgi:MinD-like ATPase involved in chromosome partitioning or flagellar assembly
MALKNNNSDGGINIIVNRCYDELEGYQAYDNLKSAVDHFLKSKINFVTEISESVEVRKSIIDQKLFAEHQKSNQVITSINKAITEFGKIHQVLNINQSTFYTLKASKKPLNSINPHLFKRLCWYRVCLICTKVTI